jgi:hypothetical protein
VRDAIKELGKEMTIEEYLKRFGVTIPIIGHGNEVDLSSVESFLKTNLILIQSFFRESIVSATYPRLLPGMVSYSTLKRT